MTNPAPLPISRTLLLLMLAACWTAHTPADGIPRDGEAVDCDVQMLVPPGALNGWPDIDVALAPPKLRWSLIQGCDPFPENNQGLWSTWSSSVYASDGNFYTTVSDHRGVDGSSRVIRYDPRTGSQTVVLDTRALFRHEPGTFGHGKIHGRLAEYPAGSVYIASYWGLPPLSAKDPATGDYFAGPIPGGHLARVDIATGTSEDLGEIFHRDSWLMFATDKRRGILYGRGYDGHILAYDLKAGKTLFCALPPAQIMWDGRTVLVDEDRGVCYGNSRDRWVRFDPAHGSFALMNARTPPNPIHGNGVGENTRGYAKHKLKDGSFLCMTSEGMMFKFFPEEDRTELLDFNWTNGMYCPDFAISPDERYVYYTLKDTLGCNSAPFQHGSPIVQYDLSTRRKKVLAFLHPYYHDKYGYFFGGSYAATLNGDGSQLFITWNGVIADEIPELGAYNNPSLMLVDIPESERME